MVKILGRTFFETKDKPYNGLSADHLRNGKQQESNKGTVQTGYAWTDRIPHPNNMQSYETWSKDPEAAISLELLTNLISGVGFYTKMPDEQPGGENKEHPKVKTINEYAESINLDEKLNQNVWQMLSKGFSPAEKIAGYDKQIDLKTLPAETFYKYRDKKGTVLKYTQEKTHGDIVAEWKGEDLNDVMLFENEPTPLNPYGISILDSIGPLIEGRTDLNQDIMRGVHRWANPIPIMETSKSKTNSTELKTSIMDRDVDEWILIYDVQEGEMRWNPLTVQPAKDFLMFTETVYTQIAEGLHAPLLLYLKNATEASATVMMESVDRFVSGKQRYIKRRVEKHLFEPLVGKPTPRLLFGKPQTGLEKVTMQEVATLVNSPALANNQKQELLKMYGINLPEPEWDTGPPPIAPTTPFGQDKKPFQFPNKQPQQGDKEKTEFLVEKLNDLDTGLNIIAENFNEGKLPITDACKLAERTIKVHMQRLYADSWELKTQEAFQKFVSERIVKRQGQRYSVRVD